jgi:hypothetical protein
MSQAGTHGGDATGSEAAANGADVVGGANQTGSSTADQASGGRSSEGAGNAQTSAATP